MHNHYHCMHKYICAIVCVDFDLQILICGPICTLSSILSSYTMFNYNGTNKYDFEGVHVTSKSIFEINSLWSLYIVHSIQFDC